MSAFRLAKDVFFQEDEITRRSLKMLQKSGKMHRVMQSSCLQEFRQQQQRIPGMAKIHSYCLDFLRDQNLIATIETAQENQSTTLNLSCYHVETVPSAVFDMMVLKKLYLDENHLHELPDCLSNLDNLHVLTVDHNHLKSLPTCLGVMRNLLHLNVSHNPLGSVPAHISTLESLDSLWLNTTELKELPSSLQSLKNLTTLGARGNAISNYPAQLCSFVNLRWLTLERNQLRQLPEEFQNLKSLKHLNLSMNLFEEIPPVLVHIKGLQFCFMCSNFIAAVSEVMLQQLKHLKRLDLRGNPVTTDINRKMYTYVVLKTGQNHNMESESSDSEDYEESIASSEINLSSGNSQEEQEPEVATTLPQLSRFAFSAV